MSVQSGCKFMSKLWGRGIPQVWLIHTVGGPTPGVCASSSWGGLRWSQSGLCMSLRYLADLHFQHPAGDRSQGRGKPAALRLEVDAPVVASVVFSRVCARDLTLLGNKGIPRISSREATRRCLCPCAPSLCSPASPSSS